MTSTVLGIDPSLRATGYVVAAVGEWVGAPGRTTMRPIEGGWIPTKPSANKKQMYAADDDTACARAVVEGLGNVIINHTPAAVFVEAPSGSQSYRGATGNGIVMGLLAALSWFHTEIPFVWINALTVKVELLGKRSGSKEEIANEVFFGMGGMGRIIYKDDGASDAPNFPKKGQEAIIDAAAVLLAAQSTDVYKLLASGGS